MSTRRRLARKAKKAEAKLNRFDALMKRVFLPLLAKQIQRTEYHAVLLDQLLKRRP